MAFPKLWEKLVNQFCPSTLPYPFLTSRRQRKKACLPPPHGGFAQHCMHATDQRLKRFHSKQSRSSKQTVASKWPMGGGGFFSFLRLAGPHPTKNLRSRGCLLFSLVVVAYIHPSRKIPPFFCVYCAVLLSLHAIADEPMGRQHTKYMQSIYKPSAFATSRTESNVAILAYNSYNQSSSHTTHAAVTRAYPKVPTYPYMIAYLTYTRQADHATATSLYIHGITGPVVNRLCFSGNRTQKKVVERSFQLKRRVVTTVDEVGLSTLSSNAY